MPKKSKVKPVLTCGCEIKSLDRPFSDYTHNKNCTCETLKKSGKVQKSSYSQISIYQK